MTCDIAAVRQHDTVASLGLFKGAVLHLLKGPAHSPCLHRDAQTMYDDSSFTKVSQ